MIHVGSTRYTGTIQADGGLLAPTLDEAVLDDGVLVEDVLLRDGLVDGRNVSADGILLDDIIPFFNGSFVESFDALVTSDGATITMTLEQVGGGDLTMSFSDGPTTLDCTPAATIALTPGTDSSPQENFIYILQSTKVLTKSTTDWPNTDTEHIRVAYFLVPSASLVNTGAAGNDFLYINQNWNDEAADASGQGHLTHIMVKLRADGATWHNGTEGTATQDGNDLWVSISEGEVSQIHPHTFLALDSDTAGAGDPILVVNDPDAAYAVVHSLNEITKLSDGTLIGNNKYLKFVLVGVANKTGAVELMLLNLPAGEYNTAANAKRDVEGYSNFSIPREFNIESSTGFLIAAFVCQHTAGGMILQETVDLRGHTPFTETGGGGAPGGGDVTASAALTDNAVVYGDGGAKGVQTGTPGISDAGVMSVPGIGDGGYATYDLCVGDVTTPSYGMIQMGNSAIGRTSFKAGAIDLDGAVICRNISGPVTGEIEFIWTESTGGTARFALPKSGVGNATYNSRSMLLIGPAPPNTNFVTVGYWQGLGHFPNIACDTSGVGADLGVQHDIELGGTLYCDNIAESTPAAGVTFTNQITADQIELADNKKLVLGTGGDAEVYYDGTDLIIAPAAVGSGVVLIDGMLEVTAIGLAGTTAASSKPIRYLGTMTAGGPVIDVNLTAESSSGALDLMIFTLTDSNSGFAGIPVVNKVIAWENRTSGAGAHGITAFSAEMKWTSGLSADTEKTYKEVGLQLVAIDPVTQVDLNASTVDYFMIDIYEAPDPAKFTDGTVNYHAGRIKGDWWMALDEIGVTFGTGEDAKISYSGADLVIESAVVGDGNVDFADQSFTGTGDTEVTGYVTLKVAGVERNFAIVR
jgi:hypothetical protein